MATKTTKKKGETTTTVSVGIRIDPKIKFALDLMGRLQKRSLTAVIEWAISNAIAQQIGGPYDRPVSQIVDSVWSTDEAVRFVNLCFHLPEALTYDELRTWETIKASSIFWKDQARQQTYDNLQIWLVKTNWNEILGFAEAHKSSSTVVEMTSGDIAIP
ncbi:hypothetical protein [Pseudomonas sp. PL-6]